MKFAQLALGLSAVAANEKVDVKEVVEIVDGFLHGALKAEGFSDIEKCVTDGEVVLKDAESAYNHFKSKDIADVVKGFKDVAAAITEIKVAMKDCSSTKADWDKLEQIAQIFKSPRSLVWHIGKDLWHNGAQIASEMGDSITDYEAKNWNKFGQDCGDMAAKVFIGAESQAYLKELKRDRVAKFYQGMLEPFGGKFNLEALLMCIHDEDQALLMADAAIQSFEEAYEKKEIGDAIGGVIAIVAAAQQFKQGLPTCEAVYTKSFDYKQFDDALDIAVHPMDHFELLDHDLLMHGHSILEDIGAGVEAYRADDYETFGRKMGEIVKLATSANALKAPAQKGWRDVYPKDNREMVTEVAQGLLEATNVGKFNFTNLLVCIYEADGAALDLYESVELLEQAWQKKDWQEALGGVMGAVAFVQGVEQALPVCEAVDSSSLNWGNVDKIARMTRCPKKTVQIVGENMLFNGVTITAEVKAAMLAWEQKEYKAFGSLLGQALTLALHREDMFLY